MKNILITFTLISLFSFSANAIAKDCYKDFLTAYDAATVQYVTSTFYCNSVTFGWGLCQGETELIYDAALSSAGNAYDNCVGY